MVCGGWKVDVFGVPPPEKLPALDVPRLEKQNLSMGIRAACVLPCCGGSKLVPFWPLGGSLDQVE